ncbi:MAG: C45 family peptidase [Actinomycetota bacterium]|nr:C45 family peptidase [Actinomycetota bacterium]
MSLSVVKTSGGPRALGRAYGEQSAAGIERAIAFYRQRAEAGSWDALVNELGPYVDAARRHLPHLAEEVEGAAEGANVDRDAVWLLNCMEEVWPFEACTTMVSGPWLMHAEQWYGGHDDIAVIVAAPEDGPGFVSPTCAGFLPVVGMSAAGFAQGIDSLVSNDERIGIPRLLVSRHGLDAHDLDEAVDFARIDGRAGGYAHVFADALRRVIVETTATTSAVIDGGAVHTNHALTPAIKRVTPNGSAGSHARLERAAELLDRRPPSTLEDCMALLSDHGDGEQSICEHGDDDPARSATVFGMICDLRAGVVYVSDGRPCGGRWVEQPVAGFRRSEVVGVV